MKLSRTLSERMQQCGTWHKKFAWLPTLLDDGSVVWLETYKWKEDYVTVLWEICFYKNRERIV
jgi:hypothetical protein